MIAADKKRTYRVEAKERIAMLTASERAKASATIQKTILAHPAYEEASLIFSYISFGPEVDSAQIIECALQAGKTLAVPAFIDDRYQMVRLKANDQLVEGHYHISEPANRSLVEPEGHKILAIVPGLAFDRACRRLGRGGGHYDRILSQILSCRCDLLSIGLSFHCSIFENLPSESFDIPLDLIVTEKESISCGTESPKESTILGR